MVGGKAEALECARTVLAAMGKNIFHAGPDGAGQVAKVCNNQLLAVQMIGTAEALALGVANGLDAATLAAIDEALGDAVQADPSLTQANAPAVRPA